MFARIICLLHDNHTNQIQVESAFLLSGLEFTHNQTPLGVNIVQGDVKQKFHVPYPRALEYIKVQLKNKLTGDEIKEVRNDLENLKESDSKNKSGVVDIDLFMAKVLDKYKNVTHRTKLLIIQAKLLNQMEIRRLIITLYRLLKVANLASRNCLMNKLIKIHQEQKNLSFNRFTSVLLIIQFLQKILQNNLLEKIKMLNFFSCNILETIFIQKEIKNENLEILFTSK